MELVPKAKARGGTPEAPGALAVGGIDDSIRTGSTHEWVAGQKGDWIVTIGDATNEQDSMFFVEEEVPMSKQLAGCTRSHGIAGLFSSVYADRGSHYWHTLEAGGKADKQTL